MMKKGEENIILATTKEEKDLGVMIDDKLKFYQHITASVSKANRTLGMIRRSFDYLDRPTLALLYKSMVRPFIEYANVVWSPYLQKHLHKLEQVQRRATRLIAELRELE